MILLNLLALVVLVALVVFFLRMLPLPAPFDQIVLVIGILIVVVACLQMLFGVDLLGHMRHAF